MGKQTKQNQGSGNDHKDAGLGEWHQNDGKNEGDALRNKERYDDTKWEAKKTMGAGEQEKPHKKNKPSENGSNNDALWSR